MTADFGKNLRKAIANAFSRSDLNLLVRTVLHDVVEPLPIGTDDMATLVEALVEVCTLEDRLPDLLTAAVAQKPQDLALQKLITQSNQFPATAPTLASPETSTRRPNNENNAQLQRGTHGEGIINQYQWGGVRFGDEAEVTGSAQVAGHNIYNIDFVLARQAENEPFSSTPNRHRILISYDNDDINALTIVSKLHERLIEDFDTILLASLHISSSQEWYSDLYTAAGLSHAAVILISNNMLQDEDMHKTIGLLAARTLNHVDISKFVFVPVLIDQVQSSKLKVTNSGLISPELDTFSPIQSNNPTEITTQVLSRLQSLETPPLDTYLNILGQGIGDILGNVFRNQRDEEKHLNSIASLLNKHLDSEFDPYKQIGWAMWRTNIFSDKRLFKFLSTILKKSDEKKLLNMLSPSWVDPWSAHWVPIAAERPPGRRAIVINRLDGFIVVCFVRRAYCCSPEHKFIEKIIDMSCYSSDSTSIDNLISLIRQQLLNQFPGKETDLEKRLCRYTTRFGPVFVVLSLLESEDLETLMNEFKYVTFFVLTNQNTPEDIDSFGNVIFPQPALCEEDFEAYDDYLLFLAV